METIGHNIERLEQKAEGQYETLHSRISDMRDDMHKAINDRHDEVMKKLDSQSASSAAQHKEISDKVSAVERWRWMLVGGAVVAGYVLAHMKLEKLF